jgi:hypothetical protein
MFCAVGLVFSVTMGVRSYFHVLRALTHFRRTEGIGYHFHVLRARTHFRRYRGRQIPFSCFALPDSFSKVPWSLGPVFMFCVPRLVFGDTENVRSRFHVLRSRTLFWRYRGRRVPCSCFVPPYSFSTVPRASGPVFMFCASGLVFGGTEGVVSRFHVFCSRTRFRRYRTRRVLFSCFLLPDSFSAVSWASDLVFMFCATGLVFGGTVGLGSLFPVLRSRTRFRRY